MAAGSVVPIEMTHGRIVLVDEVDFALVGRSRWYASQACRTWYARRASRIDGRKTNLLMHRVITGWPLVDHINGDGLDNRRVNLRPVTGTQNMRNQRKTRGVSRFKGVACDKRTGRWTAQINIARRKFHLGSYDDETAAALAYDAAARREFGAYAALNFPHPGEACALAYGDSYQAEAQTAALALIALRAGMS